MSKVTGIKKSREFNEATAKNDCENQQDVRFLFTSI